MAGIMIRANLQSGASHGSIFVTDNSKVVFRNRGHDGGGTWNRELQSGAQWIKLVKIGQQISGYTSVDGANWELMVERQANVYDNYYVGLVVTSNDNNSLASGVFSDVAISNLNLEVPVAPITLNAASTAHNNIQLTWTDNSNNETGFKVERSLNSTTGFQELATLNTNVTTYQDAGLDAATTYYYRVFAYNDAGNSEFTTAHATTLDNAPQAPSALEADATSTQNISLTWADNSNNENGFKVERSLSSNNGFEEIATLGANVTTYHDAGLDAATTYYYRILAFNDAGSSGFSAKANATTEAENVALPSPWVNEDIGNPQSSGNAAYSSGVFTINGGGSDIWGTTDQFHFVYQTLAGDGEIVAKVESMTNTNGWAKAGVMIRSSLTHNASHGMVIRTPGGLSAYQRRASNGGSSTNSQISSAANKWVKLVRTGDVLTAYTSGDGVDWQLIDTETIAMSSEVYVGLVVTSHNGASLCTALMSNVSVTSVPPLQKPAKPTSLTANASSTDNIALSWTDNSDNETGFKLERSLSSNSGFQEVATLNTDVIAYQDAGLEAATTYYYRVFAYNDAGNSDYTIAQATTQDVIPTVPTSLLATALSVDSITITWTDNSDNETGFKVERSMNAENGFQEIATLGAGVTSYQDAGLQAATAYYYRVVAYNSAGNSTYSETVNATTEAIPAGIPAPWQQTEIGSPAIIGSASYNNATNTFVVQGSGDQISSNSDQFHYVYQGKLGNGEVIAKVNTISEDGNPVLAGVMMRKDLTHNSSHASMFITSEQKALFRARGWNNTSTLNTQVPASAPHWVKLVKSDDKYTGYISENGIDWELVREYKFRYGDASDVYYGFVVTSNDPSVLSSAAISDVTVITEVTTVPVAPSALTVTATSSSSTTLTWTDNSDNETGFRLERSLSEGAGYTEITVLDANVTTFEDSDLEAATTYYYRVLAFNETGSSVHSNSANATTEALPAELPQPWVNSDIGNPELTGIATYENNAFTIQGAGADIWGNSDKFHYVYQSLEGNAEVVARVESFTNTNTWAKVGVMIRSSLAHNASHAMVVRTPVGLSAFQYRSSAGGSSSGSQISSPNSNWVKLTRYGNTFTAYTSIDGNIWEEIGTENITMPDDVFVGLAVTSHNSAQLCTAVLDNVNVLEVAQEQIPNPPSSLVVNAVSQESISLSWSDNSINETGFKVERSLSANTGFEQIADLGANAESYQDAGLQASTVYYYRVSAYNVAGDSEYSEVSSVQTTTPASNGELPFPWSFTDLGTPSVSGSVSSENNQFVVSGSGLMEGNEDIGQFVYRTLIGDGEIIAKVGSLSSTPGVEAAGVMMRTFLAKNSQQISMLATNDGKYQFKRRNHNPQLATYEKEVSFTAQWVKLVRKNGKIRSYYSEDGTTWTEFRNESANNWYFGEDILVGVVLVSGDVNTISEAIFTDIQVIQELPEPQAPMNLVAANALSTRIMLSWEYNSNEAQLFSVERSLHPDRGFKQVATVPHLNYEDANLLPATTYYYKIRAINQNGISVTSTNIANASTQPGNTYPPVSWTNTAIGLPSNAADVIYTHGKFELNGVGGDELSTSDKMNFVYQSMTGNGDIYARFNKSDDGRVAGIMIREHLGDDSKYILIGKNDVGVIIQKRDANGAMAQRTVLTKEGLKWLRVYRSGNQFVIRSSGDKVQWKNVTTETIGMTSNVKIGLALSGGGSQNNAGVFQDVSVNHEGVEIMIPQRVTSTAISANNVSLDWEYGSDAQYLNFIVERSQQANTGYEQIANIARNTYYIDTDLASGTSYFYRVKAIKSGEQSAFSDVSQSITGTSTPVPSQWNSADIGEPLAGYSTFENGTFRIWGAGNDLSNRKDECHYVYQPFDRNGEMTVKVNALSRCGNETKAGVLFRESLAGTGTRMFFISATTNGNLDIRSRSRENQSSGTHAGGNKADGSFPYWLRVVKEGSYYTAYYKTDGSEWKKAYERNVPMDQVYAGLFVNSHKESINSLAIISDVSIVNVATPGAPRELSVEVNEQSTEVTLNWKEYANGESGFRIERSVYPDSGFEVIGTVSANQTTYTDTEAPLTMCYYRVRSYDNVGESRPSNVANVYVGTINAPWMNIGVGHTAGNDTAVHCGGVFTINERGTGLSSSTDQFRFIYQDVLGDGDIVVKLNDVLSNSSTGKAGIMVRENLSSNAKMFAVAVNASNGDVTFEKRTTTGGNSTSELKESAQTPVWFKMARAANEFTIFTSTNGVNWEEIGKSTINMSDKAYFGMMAAGGGNNQSVTGVFEQVQMNRLSMGEQLLYLSRRAGDYDKTDNANVISVQTTADTANRRNTYTGMQGKSIDVGLETAISSDNATISFKFIPDNLEQNVNLVEANNIVVSLDGDRVSATIDGKVISSDMPVSQYICNHVALRLSRQEIGFYVNAEWQIVSNTGAFPIDNLKLNNYKGQTWDVQVYKGLLTDREIEVFSKGCVPSVDASDLSPYGGSYTQAICGSYKCLWAKEHVDLMQERFLYHIYEQDKSFEFFTFHAGMYLHHDLELSLEIGNATSWLVLDNEGFIQGDFSNPLNAESGQYFYHENFHNYQLFHPNHSTYGGGKYLNEATANWGASYRFGYVPNSGITGITMYPHYPMLQYGTYSVPDGNRDYHSHILMTFITKFVSTPFFIGKLYNKPQNSVSPITTITEVLAEEGHDFSEVFMDYAARTTVWDYEDGSGHLWKANEEGSIRGWENQGYEDFNHKFTNIMDESGTNGNMTAIPTELKPGVYSWNAYKIPSTNHGSYIIKLKGLTTNSTGTRFQAKVVKGVYDDYEYVDMPISTDAALGNAEAQIEVNTEAGEELYLIVASTPDEYENPYTPRYDYEYSFESNQAGRSFDLNGKDNLSVGTNTLDLVSVYPVPCDGQLTITMPSHFISEVDIKLYDMQGKLVPFTLNHTDNKLELDFDALPGNYSLRVIIHGAERTFQIVKN
ncbi:MAG: fibronectin type III domain-containing protein [Bacteroidales bacterium]|nr:fibronectin type III domain-containing protein [Bacteroidales bacterium]